MLLAACLTCVATGAAAKYTNDFSSADVGKVPADIEVAQGEFAVAERGGNRFLEVPGEPLDSFGLLFGPTQPAQASASVRVQSESTGRRFPDMGLGVGDIGGYRLMLLPRLNRLQLRKGEDPVAIADLPHPWTSGSWTRLRLRVRKVADGQWRIEGKAWPDGQPEPKDWTVSLEATEAPPAGRASLWATPFSGKPVRFDDLAAG